MGESARESAECKSGYRLRLKMFAFSSDAGTIYPSLINPRPNASGFSACFTSLLAEQMGDEHYVAVVHEDAVLVKDILGDLSKGFSMVKSRICVDNFFFGLAK